MDELQRILLWGRATGRINYERLIIESMKRKLNNQVAETKIKIITSTK